MFRFGKGFTVFELLVSLAIVALLLAAGIPAVQAWSMNMRLRAAVTDLQSGLDAARSAAINLNAQVVICPGSPGQGCQAKGWQWGWIRFVDGNGDRQLQSNETLLQQGNPVDGLSITSSANRRKLRFAPNGTAPGSNVTISFCDRRGGAAGKRLIVSGSGRVRRESASSEAPAACV